MTATSDEAKTLRWIDGFKELAPSEIRQISARCHWKWYRPDEFIVSQDDNCNDVFFIVQGRVRIANYTTSGKEVSFRDMTCGQIFGELAAIDGFTVGEALSRCQTRCSASMSAEAYWVALGLPPWPPILSGWRILCGAFNRVIEFATMPVRDRICAELLRLATQDKSDLGNPSYADACRTRQPCSDSPRSSHAGRA